MIVLRQLGLLESAGLIRLAQLEPDLEYLFRHSLVQDAAYQSLLPGDQKRLHLAVGQAMESLYPDRLDEYAPLLARHFARAGERQQALPYYERAATAALRVYANAEAESHCRSALDLHPPPARRAALLSALGESLFRQGRFARAIESWQRAIDLFGSLGDDDGVAYHYARAARAAWYAGDSSRGLRLCQDGLQALGLLAPGAQAQGSIEPDALAGLEGSPALAFLLHETGRACYFEDAADMARRFCDLALEMAERLGAIEVQADTLATLGILPDVTSPEAVAALSRSIELAEATGRLDIAVRAHHNLGSEYRTRVGDRDAAHRHFMAAVSLAQRRGAASEEILPLSGAISTALSMGQLQAVEQALAELEALLQTLPESQAQDFGLQDIKATLLEDHGRWDEALDIRRAAYEAAQQRSDRHQRVAAVTGLAGRLLELYRVEKMREEPSAGDRLQEAARLLQEGLDLGDSHLGGGIWARTHLSMAQAFLGNTGEAQRLLAEARAVPGLHDSAWEQLAFARAEAMLAFVESRWHQALEAFGRAVEMAGRHNMLWLRTCLLQDTAEVHLARGLPADLERARSLLREAQAAFEGMGSAYYANLAGARLQVARARFAAQALALGGLARELAAAGRIQEGLMPAEPPHVPGWQFAARLLPARQTSGDFYDFIPLPNGHLGLVIADVADKGAGAALYMALSSTIIRSYAGQHPERPDQLLAAVNERILADTHTDMFVTVFYGILDPVRGSLVYCNAGHYAPLLLRRDAPTAGPLAQRPALALGVSRDGGWTAEVVHVEPGDLLLLYTDGMVDAQNAAEIPFGHERLRQALADSRHLAAVEVQEAILSRIRAHVGDAPQYDDLTLLIAART